VIDLDAIETRLATRYGEVVTTKADDVLAMVAELRAARKVVAAIMDDTNDVSMRVDIALDEYEKAVGS
jgi:hypothetical protein